MNGKKYSRKYLTGKLIGRRGKSGNHRCPEKRKSMDNTKIGIWSCNRLKKMLIGMGKEISFRIDKKKKENEYTVSYEGK